MPRDKTASHERVMEAARAEFLEKGYGKASMRRIGERAGMTSAGLYRHYTSKEEMFYALVEPAVSRMKQWYREHKRNQFGKVASNAPRQELFGSTNIDMMREVVYPHKREFQMLLNGSQGTKYENFVHDLVEEQQKDMMEALTFMREQGIPVKEISKEELHMLLSAYTTAVLEPLVHDWSLEQMEHSLSTIEAFFMPGWQKLMGF